MISFEYVSFGYDGSRETLAGLNLSLIHISEPTRP